MNVSGLSPAVRERLEALAAQFLQEVPERLEQIHKLSRSIGEGAAATETLKALRLSVHKLAGAAATFGHEALTRRAKQAEHQIDRAMGAGDALEPAMVTQINRLIAELVSTSTREGEEGGFPPERSPAPSLSRELHVVLSTDDLTLSAEIASLLEQKVRSITISASGEGFPTPGDHVTVVVASSTRFRELSGANCGFVILAQEDAGADRLLPASVTNAVVLPASASAVRIVLAVESLYEQALDTRYGILVVGGQAGENSEVTKALVSDDAEIFVGTSVDSVVGGILSEQVDLVFLTGDVEGASAREIVQFLSSDVSIRAIGVVALEGVVKTFPVVERVVRREELFGDELKKEIAGRALRVRRIAARAYLDPATGLPGRSVFSREYALVASQAVRTERPLTLAIVTLLFKDLPDPQSGPREELSRVGARQVAATVIESRLRKADLCGRTGTSEFSLLLPDTPPEQAKGVLEELTGLIQAVVDARADLPVLERVVAGAAGYPAFDAPGPLRDAVKRAVGEAASGVNSVVLRG